MQLPSRYEEGHLLFTCWGRKSDAIKSSHINREKQWMNSNYSESRHRKENKWEKKQPTCNPKSQLRWPLVQQGWTVRRVGTPRYCIGEEGIIDVLIYIFSFNIQLPLSNLTAFYVYSIFNKEGLTQSYPYSKGGSDEGVISDLLQGRRKKIIWDLLQELWQETKAEIV